MILPLHQPQHCWLQPHQAGDKSEHCQPCPRRVHKDPAKSNSEVSREVFKVSLISFRGAQMNCRLKPCKKKVSWELLRWDWLQRDQRNFFALSDLQKELGKRRFPVVLVYLGGNGLNQCWAALSSPTTVNSWSSGSQTPHFPVPLDSNRTPEQRNPLPHGLLQMRIRSSVSGNSHLVSSTGHNAVSSRAHTVESHPLSEMLLGDRPKTLSSF